MGRLLGLRRAAAAQREAERAAEVVAPERPALETVRVRRLRAVVFARMPRKHFERSLLEKLLAAGVRTEEYRTPERVEKMDLARFDVVVSFCKGMENRAVVAAAKAQGVACFVLDRKPDESWRPLLELVAERIEGAVVDEVPAPPALAAVDEKLRAARSVRELVARLVSLGHDDAKKVAVECGRLAALGLPLFAYGEDPVERVARACVALGLYFPEDGPAPPPPESEPEPPPPLPPEESTREDRDAAVVHDFAQAPPATFGEALRRAREAEGLSRLELGELVGVTRTAVEQWEHDDTVPISEHAVKIFALFPVLGVAPPPVRHHRDMRKPGRVIGAPVPYRAAPAAAAAPAEEDDEAANVLSWGDAEKEDEMKVHAGLAEEERQQRAADARAAAGTVPVLGPASVPMVAGSYTQLSLDELAEAEVTVLRAEASRLRRRLIVVEALLSAAEKKP